MKATKNSNPKNASGPDPKRAAGGSKKKRAVIICCTVVAFLGAVSLALYVFVGGGQAEVMRVNGLSVTREEFQFYMENIRSDVSNYFHQNYGATVDSGFWTRTFGGERPIDRLRVMAKENCIRDKTVQSLALKYDLTDDVSFSGFKDRWKNTNAQREAEAAAGKTLYGVKQFTLLQYYLQMMSNLTTELQDKVENAEVFVEDAEVRALYDERHDVYNSRDNLKVAEMFVPYAPSDGVSAERDEAYARALSLKEQLSAGADFDALCQSETGQAPAEITLSMDASLGDPASSQALVARQASVLSVNEYSEPFENGFGFSILKLLDEDVAITVTYEEASRDLYNTVLSQKFEQYLIEQAKQADVTVTAFVYNSVGI